jgi:hypothetical protein
MDDLRKLVTCHIFETKPLKKVGRRFREQNDGLQAPLSCPFDAIADQIDSPIACLCQEGSESLGNGISPQVLLPDIIQFLISFNASP